MPDSLPPLRARSGPLDLFSGFALPLRAFGLMLTTPALFGLTLVCAVVTGGVLLGLVIGMWPAASHLAERVAGAGVAGTLLTVGLYLILLVTSALTVPSVVLSPLADPLSESTEKKLGGYVDRPFTIGSFLRGVRLSLRHSLTRLALMLLGMVALLPLNWVPGIGSVVYAVLSVAWSAWWVCAEYLSGPAARHQLGVRAAARAMRERPFLCLGVGLALYFLLWIPVLNFFLVPAAVVAGTLLFRQLKNLGAFEPVV